eukprot:9481315-Pyramimonas_sp.AAC.1
MASLPPWMRQISRCVSALALPCALPGMHSSVAPGPGRRGVPAGPSGLCSRRFTPSMVMCPAGFGSSGLPVVRILGSRRVSPWLSS